jgi:hypothetical protein
VNATLERDFFGGVVRGLVGISAGYASVRQWTGETVKADTASASDVDARQAPTRLDRDCAAGLVVDSLADLELKRFRNGQGAGFRIAWNQATIIVVDYGVSREGSTLYVNFNHPF